MLTSFITSRFSKSLRADGFSRFTTRFSLVSVALGTLALVLSISILQGYEDLIVNTAMRYTSHIEIRGLREEGIYNADSISKRISALPGVKAVHSIYVSEVLARSKSGVDGAIIHGVSQQHLIQQIGPVVETGTPGGNGCNVGSTLARTLGIKVADTLAFFAANNTNGQVVPILFSMPVASVFSTGMHSVDATTIMVRDSVLTSALSTTERVGPAVLSVELADPEQADAFVRKIHPFIEGEAIAFTWKIRFQSISSWIELQREPIPIVLGLIAIVASFTIVSMLLVSVTSKTRSIAMLLSLGMTPRRVMVVFALRAIRISAFGSALGSAIAFTFALVQSEFRLVALDGAVYYVSSLPVSLDPAPFIIIPLMSVALAILASLAPMLAIKRIKPAAALRFS